MDLSKYNDDYDRAEVQEFGDVPDGTYQVSVEKAQLKETNKEKKPMLSWQLDILNGPQRGRKLFCNNVIASEKGIQWLKTNLAICGVELGQLTDLEARLEDLIGVTLEVKQTTRDKNSNVWFQKQIDIEVDADRIGGDDSLPF